TSNGQNSGSRSNWPRRSGAGSPPDSVLGSRGKSRRAIRMTSGPNAIIVGAGPAGLACAVTLRAAGLSVTVLERADEVGSAWRRHYDRLHLHTDRNHSALPGMAMPATYPTYPSRAQMV